MDEERWKALQNYQMLTAQKYVENVYYHELTRALRRCGYTIENSARGDFRVVGIAPELADRFSKRHRQIDEQTSQFLREHPEKSSGNINDVREHLAHRLRSRKMSDLPPERLRALWQSQLTPGDEPSLHVPSASGEPEPVSAAAAVDWAEEHLFDRRSVVREHDLWRHALEFARGSTLTLAGLKRETAARDYLRQADGKLTRKDVLGREWRIVQMAKHGAGQFGALVSRSPLSRQQLADDQQRAFEQILASRDFVTLFRGGAGTGKSYVLRSVQGAIKSQGGEIVVLAPQRQQVLDLQRDGLLHLRRSPSCCNESRCRREPSWSWMKLARLVAGKCWRFLSWWKLAKAGSCFPATRGNMVLSKRRTHCGRSSAIRDCDRRS